MLYYRLAVGFAILSVASALGWICHRVATRKGRSGWWGLAGPWLLFGLVAVLILSRRQLAQPIATGSHGDPYRRPPGRWNSKIMHRKRSGWRSSNVLFLLELQISLIMWGWLGIGSFIWVAVFRDVIAGNPVNINGVRTDSPLAYLVALVFCGFFSACGALYVFEIRPSLIERSERDHSRRARRKRRASPPPGQ